MYLTLNRFFIFIIILFFYQHADGQKSGTKRFIAYAELADPSNLPFRRPSAEVSAILLDGVRKGLIPLYYFDSFKKPPKSFSWKQLKQKLEILEMIRFKPWEKGVTYGLGAEVISGNYHFRSMHENNTEPLGADGSWVWLGRSDHILGIDFLIRPGGDSVIQYLHFYTDDFKYEASFKASDAANFLNATGYLWYRIEDHFMHHLFGDIFLFDDNDENKILDLRPWLDSTYRNFTKESLYTGESVYGILTRYNNGRITEFLFAQQGRFDDYHAILDTIPFSEIRKNLEKESTGFYLLGDALLKPGVLRLSATHKTIASKPFTAIAEQVIPTRVDTITYRTTEYFRLSGQSNSPRVFGKNVSGLLDLIYEGISANELHVYLSDTMNRVYSTQELVRQWTIEENKPKDWDSTLAYDNLSEALYKGLIYTSQGRDSAGGPPSEKPEKWKAKYEAEEICQPDNIFRLEFVYEITFTAKGNILSKEPVTIGLECLNNNSATTLGYLSFTELKMLTMKQKPDLWKRIVPWLERQNGLYQTMQNSPLKVHKR